MRSMEGKIKKMPYLYAYKLVSGVPTDGGPDFPDRDRTVRTAETHLPLGNERDGIGV